MLVDEMSKSIVITSENAAKEPGPSQPKRTCPLKSTVLLDVISEIITDSKGDTPSTTTEVEKFLSESLLGYKTGNPHTWWSQNKGKVPYVISVRATLLMSPSNISSLRMAVFLQQATYTTIRETEFYLL